MIQNLFYPSVNEWIKKLWYIYTMEYDVAERKKKLPPFAIAWMELERIMLSEISQEQSEYTRFIKCMFCHSTQRTQPMVELKTL